MKKLGSWLKTTLLLVVFSGAGGGCGKGTESAAGQGNLQEAIKARTEVTQLQQEIASTAVQQAFGKEQGHKTMQAMRKLVARAEGKQEEGNILLTKDRYSDAVESYKEAAKLYRQALDWRKVEKDLAKAERGVLTARMLAEAAGTTNQAAEFKGACGLQINAEGFLDAGEVEQTLAEYEKARKAFEKLVPGAGSATLEDAVAARTAMLSMREGIKGLPKFDAARAGEDLEDLLITRREAGDAGLKGPKPGSLPDLLSRSRKAELAAGEALESRQYSLARALFAAVGKLYQEAAGLQGKGDQVLASRQSVADSMKLADSAFKSDVRPASYERGKQALADADKALAEGDLDAAKPLLTQAAGQFAAARGEAEALNAMGEAQQVWSAALAAADEDMVNRHAAKEWRTAKAQADQAQTKAAAGETAAATKLFTDATAALSNAVGIAKTKENAAKALPVVQRLEATIERGDKFAAEIHLKELEDLIPTDVRMKSLRDKTAALPWPQSVSLPLKPGVAMEFIRIRPGSFTMGSEKGEKPVRKVTITKPFYMAKYEVTQEQWESLMGNNPSNFKGGKNPVENVSWNDCQGFLAKLKEKAAGMGVRLPTEAEWEYACRAGSATEFCYGDDEAGLGEYAWFSSNAGSTTHPAGEKKPNAWGLYDMHGNVWEWCSDWYGTYGSTAETDPVGPSSGSGRVLRGGSWVDNAGFCRSASRSYDFPGYRLNFFGLRVVGVVR